MSKAAVWKLVFKFKERLNITTVKRFRRLVALDETGVRVNDDQYWVYVELNVDSSELIAMRVYANYALCVEPA